MARSTNRGDKISFDFAFQHAVWGTFRNISYAQVTELEEDENGLIPKSPSIERDALMNKCRQAFAEHFENPNDGPFYFVVTPARLFLIGEQAQACRDRALVVAVPYYMVVYGRRRISDEKFTQVYDCASGKMHQIWQPYSDLKLYEPYWMRPVRAILSVVMFTIDMDVVIATSMPEGVNMGQEAALELCMLILHRRLTDGLRPAPVSIAAKDLIDICLQAEKRYFNRRYNLVDLLLQTTAKSDNFMFFEADPSSELDMNFNAVHINYHFKKEIALVLIDSGVRCDNLVNRLDEKWEEMYEVGQFLYAHNWKTVHQPFVTEHLKGWKLIMATHFYDELHRIDQVIKALLDDDYFSFGQTLTESHISCRDVFKISCPEVDRIVELSLQVPGVYGSRIVTYGFGGFVITVVDRIHIPRLVGYIKMFYEGKPKFHECIPVENLSVYEGDANH